MALNQALGFSTTFFACLRYIFSPFHFEKPLEVPARRSKAEEGQRVIDKNIVGK